MKHQYEHQCDHQYENQNENQFEVDILTTGNINRKHNVNSIWKSI